MEIINIIILILTFFIGESRHLKYSSFWLIGQSLFLVVGVLITGYLNDIPFLYFIAFIDLIIRVFLMPYVIIKSIKKRHELEIKPTINNPLSIALSIVILSVIYHFIETIKILMFSDALPPFACGLTLFIYGFYLFISKNDIIKMIISFFIIENGIHLLIISLVPHMPKAVEIALTLNFVIALLFFLYINSRLYYLIIKNVNEKAENLEGFYNLKDNKSNE